jgi:aquaporin Z
MVIDHPRRVRSAMSTETELQTTVAEFLGTLVLVFFAVGATVLAGEFIGTLGIALAFGFTLLAIAYALGPISGAHVNPAVTLGMLAAKRLDVHTAIRYWVAQIAGAIAGAALLFLVAKQVPGLRTSESFGTTGFGDRSAVRINTGGAFLAELMLTMLLVYVYLCMTNKVTVAGFGGLPIGITLAVVNLIGIPLTGASVNPARSFGPAIFAGGAALTQLWLFIVAPLVGGVLAAAVHRFTHPSAGGEMHRRLQPSGSPTR